MNLFLVMCFFSVNTNMVVLHVGVSVIFPWPFGSSHHCQFLCISAAGQLFLPTYCPPELSTGFFPTALVCGSLEGGFQCSPGALESVFSALLHISDQPFLGTSFPPYSNGVRGIKF